MNGAITRLSIILKLTFLVNSLKTVLIQSLFEERVLICVVLWLCEFEVVCFKKQSFFILLSYSKDNCHSVGAFLY